MKPIVIKAALALALAAMLAGCAAPAANTPEQTTAPAAADTSAATSPETSAAATQATKPDSEWGRTVTRGGKTWRYNSRLRNVLFMGVDSKAEVASGSIVGDGGRSDTLILFVIDPDSETIQMIPISRDTITEIDIYKDGKFLFNGDMQVTMQYAFGDSPARSCQLTKRTVSEMLLDLPINSYFSLTLDGVAAAVNMIGGIELTIPEDWTDIDPSYTAGTTVKMDADAVERFLRFRDIETLGSNNTRMSRQSWFIQQMFAKLVKTGRIGTEAALKILDPYLETDMDADTIKQMTSFTFAQEPIVLPGENVAGERHDEFYLDEAALEQVLLQVFYNPVD